MHLLLTITAATTPVHAQNTLSIFAAASLREALETAVQDWPDQDILISASGSGTIARQIVNGAPADVVVLAHPKWMDWLEDQGAIIDGTRATPFANTLTLVGPIGAAPLPDITSKTLLERLGPTGRLAIGEHRAVPAGQYAKLWLEQANLWDALKNRLAETDSVRSAFALAARGEVPLALVYQTDLIAAPNDVTKLWDIQPDQQPDIRYTLAAITKDGIALAEFLTQSPAFAEHGFTQVAP